MITLRHVSWKPEFWQLAVMFDKNIKFGKIIKFGCFYRQYLKTVISVNVRNVSKQLKFDNFVAHGNGNYTKFRLLFDHLNAQLLKTLISITFTHIVRKPQSIKWHFLKPIILKTFTTIFWKPHFCELLGTFVGTPEYSQLLKKVSKTSMLWRMSFFRKHLQCLQIVQCHCYWHVSTSQQHVR